MIGDKFIDWSEEWIELADYQSFSEWLLIALFNGDDFGDFTNSDETYCWRSAKDTYVEHSWRGADQKVCSV